MEGFSSNSDVNALGLSSRCRTLGEALFMCRKPRGKRLAALEKQSRGAGPRRIFLCPACASSVEQVRDLRFGQQCGLGFPGPSSAAARSGPARPAERHLGRDKSISCACASEVFDVTAMTLNGRRRLRTASLSRLVQRLRMSGFPFGIALSAALGLRKSRQWFEEN